ncbi:tRNA synthetases class I, catalytic domain-containing protein [Mycena sp. CBHHK59/15]|nr:tRNA synthetases class I, catalytic domain-containing protein [Mycena sp. CBHHK59/15]
MSTLTMRCFMPTALKNMSTTLSDSTSCGRSQYHDTSVHIDDNAVVTVLETNDTRIGTELEIAHSVAMKLGFSGDRSRSQVPKMAYALSASSEIHEIIRILNDLDNHLAFRTFLVGHEVTEAHYVLWGCMKEATNSHFQRWLDHLESLDPFQSAMTRLAGAKAKALRTKKTAAGFALGRPNATQGNVVTRFPPEPSGYLHIGQTKAVMLNRYFAEMYNGKFLIRFDDTNPSKEKTDFEDTILEDLPSHTSDYFEQLHTYAVQLIRFGVAYADDTDATTMAYERFHGIPSLRRDASIEENLVRFSQMTDGVLGSDEAKWCLRAKISIDNPNKAMRDPVIYRCNPISHHRTGDKWKVYPTYDFACPVVDSIEGVTHALRTNEYRDRNPQYHWMIEALGLRPVNIWDFRGAEFYTLQITNLMIPDCSWFVCVRLSLPWSCLANFRLPGIRRRGFTVEALLQFMLQQGPSQAVLSLEWDSLWALNKKIIDPKAPRFLGSLSTSSVSVTVHGGPTEPCTKLLPKHKKNPAVGEKTTVYANKIIVEQVDAASFGIGEEITLMDWGNLAEDGQVSSVTVVLNLEGDFKATKKKVTWLAQTADRPLVEATLLDYDCIITKKKLEEGDNWEEFVTPRTEFSEDALADANVNDLAKGDIVQFERKGYFVFDGVVDRKLEFITIPDGRAASLSSKAAIRAG